MKRHVFFLIAVCGAMLCACTPDQDLEQEQTQASGKYKGHYYVDLGLPSGTMWATCNIGATAPEEWGEYYAWGETETKEKFTVDNYAGRAKASYFEDAATACWGGKWRMPTQADFEELIEYCTWENVLPDKGVVLTSTVNGNTIFFPAAYFGGDGWYCSHPTGAYWSSTELQGDHTFAANFVITVTDEFINDPHVSTQTKYSGSTIRPVMKK